MKPACAGLCLILLVLILQVCTCIQKYKTRQKQLKIYWKKQCGDLFSMLIFVAMWSSCRKSKTSLNFIVWELFLFIFIHMYNYFVISISFSWEWVPWKPRPYFSVNLINEHMKSVMKTWGIEFYLKFIYV